jgi:glycolate oxidase FAD binding subunit
MTLRAKAGTPLAVVEAALAAHGQMLPFEPIDHRALFGGAGEPTVGGLVAVNASGPRRVSAGAARDSLIGLRLVNGRGEAIASGGRVMKNVAGLDLVKVNCGAHGALGLVTEATFKLLPKPQAQATIVLRRLDDEAALAAMTRALASPYGVSGAAWIGPGMGREFSRAILRVEGFADSVAYRAERLIALNADLGAKHALTGEDSASLWRAVRDAEFIAEPRERAIWRVSLAPSKAPRFIARLGAEALAHLFDWGGGLVWLASEPTESAASAVRAALAPLGGHATLVRAPDELRARVDVFEPLAPALARLTRGVKASFDPDGVFNFGRMFAGM